MLSIRSSEADQFLSASIWNGSDGGLMQGLRLEPTTKALDRQLVCGSGDHIAMGENHSDDARYAAAAGATLLKLHLDESALEFARAAQGNQRYASVQLLEANAARWGEVPLRFSWEFVSSAVEDPAIMFPFIERRVAEYGADFDEDHATTHIAVLRGDVIGYVHMLALKIYELNWGALEALQCGHFATAAPLARSAVEVAAYAMRTQDLWDALHKSKDVREFGERNRAVVEFVDAGMFGSRMTDAKIKSVNVLTVMRNVLKKRPDDPESEWMLGDGYAALSDLVHPNAPGYQLYWHAVGGWKTDRPVQLIVDRSRVREEAGAIAYGLCLQAVAFSSNAVLNARDFVNDRIKWCPLCTEYHRSGSSPHSEDLVFERSTRDKPKRRP